MKEIADAYVTKPVIQDPYFGWCLFDSLIFTEIKSFLRVMMATQFGSVPGIPAYFLSKGNEARYDLLRPLFFVLAIVFNYVTPVAIGYYAVENGHQIIGGLFCAIAAVGVLSYVATYSKRQATKKSDEEKLKKVLGGLAHFISVLTRASQIALSTITSKASASTSFAYRRTVSCKKGSAIY